MDISTYQIQHMLNVYNNQLRSERLDDVKKPTSFTLPPDPGVKVTLSEEGKQLLKEAVSQAAPIPTPPPQEPQGRAQRAENPPRDSGGRRDAEGKRPQNPGRR